MTDVSPLDQAKRRIVRAVAGLVEDIAPYKWSLPLVGGAEILIPVEGGVLKGYAGEAGEYSLSITKGAVDILIIVGPRHPEPVGFPTAQSAEAAEMRSARPFNSRRHTDHLAEEAGR